LENPDTFTSVAIDQYSKLNDHVIQFLKFGYDRSIFKIKTHLLKYPCIGIKL